MTLTAFLDGEDARFPNDTEVFDIFGKPGRVLKTYSIDEVWYVTLKNSAEEIWESKQDDVMSI